MDMMTENRLAQARAEAERGVDRHCEALWEREGELLDYTGRRAYERGFEEGALWAVEQEPTDEEVEAADTAFHEVIMSGEWVSQRQAIRAALIAASEVRKA